MYIYTCAVVIPVIWKGPFLLPHHQSGLLREVRDKVESLIAEVVVSKDSPFVGQTIETMMNSLGIAPSRVIKIRRCQRGSSDSAGKTNNASNSLLDSSYIKRVIPFWGKSSASNATSNDYSPQRTADDGVDVEVNEVENATETTGNWFNI